MLKDVESWIVPSDSFLYAKMKKNINISQKNIVLVYHPTIVVTD